MRRALFLALALSLAACAHEGNYKTYLARKRVTNITPESFSHCSGYGCKYVNPDVRLPEKDWKEIRKVFRKPAKDAAEERERIAKTIGLFEEKTGAVTGTAEDVAGTYHKLGRLQHDCVDESVNTTIYLSLLEQRENLKFHFIEAPSARVPPFSFRLGPHQTAVIREKETGARFAVDSWFHDNGHAAEIVPMEKWFFGWRPDGKPPANGE